MTPNARHRMIASASALMAERGVDATSFSEVVAHADAPRGSIAHYFPGGKEQMIAEATLFAGETLAAGLVAAVQTDDPLAAIRLFNVAWTTRLDQSDFAAGCPIVAATVEGDRAPAARQAAGQVFARWESLLADGVRSHLADPSRAEAIATLVVAAIEGAVLVSRAQRSSEALRKVGGELDLLLESALIRSPDAG